MALVAVDGVFKTELITLMGLYLTREVTKGWRKEALGKASQPDGCEFFLGQTSAGSHQKAPHRSRQPPRGPLALRGRSTEVSAQLGVTRLGSSSRAAAPRCLLTLPTSAPRALRSLFSFDSGSVSSPPPLAES